MSWLKQSSQGLPIISLCGNHSVAFFKQTLVPIYGIVVVFFLIPVGKCGITLPIERNIVSKTGLKKGKYTIKVKVTAAGNKNYNKVTKIVKVKHTKSVKRSFIFRMNKVTL